MASISPMESAQNFFFKCVEAIGENEIEQLKTNLEAQKQKVIEEAKIKFEEIKALKEIEIEDTEKFKTLSKKCENLIYENELLRRAHPNIRLRRFLSVSLLVSALAAGIIGAVIGCVVTAVVGFVIAAMSCVPVMLNYAKEASDLVDEQIAEEELKNNNKG